MPNFVATHVSYIRRGLTRILEHAADFINPHRVTAHQAGAYTTEEVDALIIGARHTGIESLAAGIVELEIDLTAFALAAAPAQTLVTMEGPDGGVLLYPMVVVVTSTALKVAWQAETPDTDYSLHWELIE